MGKCSHCACCLVGFVAGFLLCFIQVVVEIGQRQQADLEALKSINRGGHWQPHITADSWVHYATYGDLFEEKRRRDL